MRKIELLAPAGSFDKLKTAIYFGADALYMGGSNFGLRAYADNFNNEELKEAVKYAHERDKKIYITTNIFARNSDIKALEEFFKYLEEIKVDGVLISDLGVISVCKKVAPSLTIHVSTQANTTNVETVKVYKEMGVKRVVVARELSLKEIKEIKDVIPDIEIEAFVHGAMCIAYSGRCLLSNVLTNRESNRGECVQACRWEYMIHEVSRPNNPLTIEQDDKGTYILNSRDLNMLKHLDDLYNAGVDSLKIEGRMKSNYYVASVVNAYRRALDSFYKNEKYTVDDVLIRELEKTSHRKYTTGFFYGRDYDEKECLDTSYPTQEYEFMAEVLDEKDGIVTVEMRNRFKEGDVLEILSPSDSFNKKIVIPKMINEKGEEVVDAKLVQEKLSFRSDIKLSKGDILRKEIKEKEQL